MRLKLILSIVFLFYFSIVKSQNTISAFGIERLQYSTGNISGISAEIDWTDRTSLNFKIGREYYSWVGYVNEEAEGFGGTIGIRFYSKKNNYKRFFIGIGTDIFQTEVKTGERDHGRVIPTTAKIISFQPSISPGYVYQIGDHFRITPTLAVGYQWNIQLEGSQVSYGNEKFDPIVLMYGLNLGYRIPYKKSK